MKKYLISAFSVGVFVCLTSLSSMAQTAAGGSASGTASVSQGQASAGANASQSAQTPGGSADAGASANAAVSHQHESKTPDKDSGAKNSSSKKSDDKSGKSSASPDSSAALNSGSTLQAELAKSVDCKKAKPGDEVTAKLTQDVKSDGKVVLHKGSKLVGHVTEAQAKSKENAESKLGIVFDKAVLKGGQEVAFNGAVQALAPPVQGALSAASAESADMAGAGMARGGNMGGTRGTPALGGGLSSTVGAATNTVGNTAGSVTGAAGGAVTNTAGTAVNGTVNSTSHGVIGLQGLTLNSAAAGSAQGSVISSATQNVKLDAGTQMVLQVVGAGK